MMYRNDHDAALARLEILEHEHRVLVEELTRARAPEPKPVRAAWLAHFVRLETKIMYAMALCLLASRFAYCS